MAGVKLIVNVWKRVEALTADGHKDVARLRMCSLTLTQPAAVRDAMKEVR